MCPHANNWSSLFQQHSVYTESGSGTVTVLHSYVFKQLSTFTLANVALSIYAGRNTSIVHTSFILVCDTHSKPEHAS